MRNIKVLFVLLSLCTLVFIPQKIAATHYMGMDISYECLGTCTYRVTVRVYRDCAGSDAVDVDATTFSIITPPGCVPPTAITAWSAPVVNNISPVCGGTVTCCDYPPFGCPAGVARGVEEWIFTRDYDFCSSTCTNYTLQWHDAARNNAITSLDLTFEDELWHDATVINPTISPCNNSPYFGNPPTPFICASQPYTFNQEAIDPDGDSLSYSLGPCSDESGDVNYLPGYSATAPLGPDWIVTVNPITGDITITPNPASPTPGSPQVGVLCVYVTEWRGGVAIGTVMRDVQVSAEPCPNTLPTIPGMTGVTGGVGSGFIAATCLGNTLCFDIPTVDPDAADTLTIYWNHALSGLGGVFSSAAPPVVFDTVTGVLPVARFCWTPPAIGTYSFLVTVRDNACPIFGQNQYTFQIFVSTASVAGDWVRTTCTTADFCVTSAFGWPPLSYSWSGSGGMSSTDSCFTYNYGTAGSFPYTLTVTDSIGCTATFTDTVEIPSFINPDAGPDDTTCTDIPVNLNGSAHINCTYLWTPAVGLSDPTIPNPVATLTNPGPGPITQTYVYQVTDTILLCSETDTVNIVVYPEPLATFDLPDSGCVDAPVTITYTGGATAGGDYAWVFSGGTPPFAVGQGPHNVTWSVPGDYEVALVVAEFGCTSAVYLDTISIFPNPTAVIGPVNDQCFIGHSFFFFSTGVYGPGATFDWNFSSTINPTSTDENPAGMVFDAPGVHWATLTVTDNGCVSTMDSISFTIFPNPDASFILLGDSSQCFDDHEFIVMMTSVLNPGATFFWTFENGIPPSSTNMIDSFSVATPGTWDVSLTVIENGCPTTALDSATVFPNPIVDAGLPVAFCEGEGGAQVTATWVGGGLGPVYYQWWCDSTLTYCGLDSVFDNDPIANPDVSTWYYCQITDFNGCLSNIDSVFVTVIPKPIVDAGPDVWVCQPPGPCEQFNATVSGSPGPFSYQWSPSLGLSNDTIPNPCARPDTTTIYTLVVTDLTTGCTSDATTTDTLSTATAHVLPLPIANAGNDVEMCEGDTVMLHGIGWGAGPTYSYEWSPYTPPVSLSANNIPNPLAFPELTTEYILVVWSNGCPSYGDTIRVNVHTMPTVDAGPDRDICQGETAFLDGQAGGDSSATGYTFEWFPNTDFVGSNLLEDVNVNPDTTTWYYIVATSSWGCLSPVDSALVTVKSTPIPEAGPPITICQGDTVQIPGFYYYDGTLPSPASEVWISWTPNTSISDSSVIDPFVWPDMSMYYHVQLQHNTCFTEDSVLITVIPMPIPDVSADTTIICDGQTVQLHVTGGLGGATISWNPPTGLSDPSSAHPFATPDTTTVYSITLSEGGCSRSDSVRIEVYPTPEAGYLSSDLVGCAPHHVDFLEASTEEIYYIWNFGDGSPVSNEPGPGHTYTVPGSYTVVLTVVSAGGCSDTISNLQVNVGHAPVANFTSDPVYPVELHLPASEVHFLNNSTYGVEYLWDFGDEQTLLTPVGSLQFHPYHLYTMPGEYYVTLTATSPEGCVDRVTHGPYIVKAPDLFIPNVFSPNDDGVNDVFLVNYTGDQTFNLQIFDRWGVKMHESTNKYEGWDGLDLQGSEAVDGVYYYTVRAGNREFSGHVSLIR